MMLNSMEYVKIVKNKKYKSLLETYIFIVVKIIEPIKRTTIRISNALLKKLPTLKYPKEYFLSLMG